MKSINKPEYDMSVIIDNCTEHMRKEWKDRIQAVKNTIIQETATYDELAMSGCLCNIEGQTDVDGIADKDDMTNLYTQKFVPMGQKNRKYYDEIMMLTQDKLCAYCRKNGANTLDHFLPKARYVVYSVTPYNLVPSCSNCNHDKLDSTFLQYSEQPFHPYYDEFDDVLWLKARLIENPEVSFQFYTDTSEVKDKVKAQRIELSFSDKGYKLNKVYLEHVPAEYRVRLKSILRQYRKGGKEAAVEYLNESIQDEQSVMLNSWKAAIYQAIIDNEWFWNTHIPSILE